MDTPTPIYRYPLDGTGTSPDNLVVGEEHQLSNRTVRCVAPTYGGFFAESMIVKDAATNLPLVKGTDYYFGELFEFPTGRYGKEIFGIVVITKPGVTKVILQYQALGGDYSYSMDAIIAMIDNLNLGERPVEWGSIIGRPALFEPASHLHDLGDVYGFEYVVSAIIQLRNAILQGDVASHDEIYRYIDRLSAEQSEAIAKVSNDLAAHVARTDNPHNTTKSQVGLGNVQNYAVATQTQMNAGTANNLYLTPVTVATYVSERAVNPLTTHMADTSNPHNTTKSQVGLGSVDNFPTATEAIAVAGTSNAHFMTPLATAKAITAQAGSMINSHIENRNNPHGVTAAQVGTYTKAQIDTQVGAVTTSLNNHVGNTNNPHGTTAAQVGAYTRAQIDSTVNNLQNQINGKQPTGPYAQTGVNMNVSFWDVYANGTIFSANDVWAFNSDERLKKNVRVIDNALEKLRKIRGVLYRYKVKAIDLLNLEDRVYMGVIAQEIQKVCPEIVGLAPFDRDPQTGKSISGRHFLTVQYDKLSALLIEALKESDARVTEIAHRLGFDDLA